MKQVRFALLLTLAVSILAGEGFHAQERPAGRKAAAIGELPLRFDAVHAVGGSVFGVSERADGTIAITWIPTVQRAAAAFGLSPDGAEVVYMPLVGDFVTRELWRERLDTGERSRVTTLRVIAASVAAGEPFTVAFTHDTEHGFGASFANLRGELETRIPSPYVMPDFIHVDARGVVSYFEEDDPRLALSTDSEAPSLRPTSFDPASGSLRRTPPDSERFPQLVAEIPGRIETMSEAPSSPTAFTVSSGDFHVEGDTFLGEASLLARHGETTTNLGKGILLSVLSKGVIVRRIAPNTTSIDYVTLHGQATVIGTNAELTFTLPLENSVLTRNGIGYSDQCAIKGEPHDGVKKYAYDFQSSAEAHIFAVAPGTIVGNPKPVNDVTCNSLDPDCMPKTGTCASNGGWGNSVVYVLSDWTYIRTAHHSAFSYQLGDTTTLCLGRYYARQGSTGNSTGDAVDGCGAHVHIQRQTGTAGSAESIRLPFNELGGTAGKCRKSYPSQTKEVSSCPAASLTSLSITGPSSLNENTSAGYEAIAKWSDNSMTTVKPDWSENSSYTTISSKGVLEAKSVTSNKTVTVKASYSFGGVTKTATKNVTIVDGKTLTSLSITGSSSLNENSSTDYHAVAKWGDNSATTVKPDWSENSSYATISSSGLLEATSVSSNKAVTVKATYSSGGVTKTATKDVTIVDGKTLKSVSISGPSSVNENSSADYDATAKRSDNSTTTVKPDWSENSSYTTISSTGLLEARSVSSNKTVTVKATYSFGGVTETATKDVTVRNR